MQIDVTQIKRLGLGIALQHLLQTPLLRLGRPAIEQSVNQVIQLIPVHAYPSAARRLCMQRSMATLARLMTL
jgi:hypothetical protein